VDHLRGAVWEVRTSLVKRIARTLLAVESGVMVLLHSFIKKTRATSGSEIDLAEKRYKEWKHGEK
jgi:phage-related protein